MESSHNKDNEFQLSLKAEKVQLLERFKYAPFMDLILPSYKSKW